MLALVLKNWRFLAAGLAALLVMLAIYHVRETYLERDSLRELAAAQEQGLKALRENADRAVAVIEKRAAKDRKQSAEINRLKRELSNAESQPCPIVADTLNRLRQHHEAGQWASGCAAEPDATIPASLPATDSGRIGADYILTLYESAAGCASQLEALQDYIRGNR
jgi:hypothetical protein